MGNMSYCRFRNTLTDLRDCYESMGEFVDAEGDGYDNEATARRNLIALCQRIATDYGDEVEDVCQ